MGLNEEVVKPIAHGLGINQVLTIMTQSAGASVQALVCAQAQPCRAQQLDLQHQLSVNLLLLDKYRHHYG